MKLSELVAPQRLDRDVDIVGITADSRDVAPGFLFAALKGVAQDGAAFIPDAVAKGAAAVLCAPGTPADGAALITDPNPRKRLAELAARFYARQPDVIVAVTGTNGKSSTVDFLRQIWRAAGFDAASLGTLGVSAGARAAALGHTTPDPVAIHKTLDWLAGDGVTHAAMEASSHGLAQHRLDAVRLTAVGFTNLTQDHLDYHADFDAYFAAKLRLFTELAPLGAPAVINVDSDWGRKAAEIARERGLAVLEIGWRGADLKLCEVIPRAAGQTLMMRRGKVEIEVELPLPGEFQAHNAMMAAALAISTGVDVDAVFSAIGRLEGVRGRLEPAGVAANGAPAFVDYAHTPDGLEKLLRALRPHTKGRLVLVFGCGGDRDPTKRVKMGEVAARLADIAIVTDDNPRTEDPAAIRKAVLAGCPDAVEIGDRAQAIAEGARRLEPGDALVVAGKGHETGQIVGATVTPFDDVEVARAALAAQP